MELKNVYSRAMRVSLGQHSFILETSKYLNTPQKISVYNEYVIICGAFNTQYSA